MSFKNNTALRTATIAASFMLTLLIAAFATGCAAKGSSGAQSAAPGSYAIDPATVDSSTITEPVSCMVVTSASCCVPIGCLRRRCATWAAGPRTRCADAPNYSVR